VATSAVAALRGRLRGHDPSSVILPLRPSLRQWYTAVTPVSRSPRACAAHGMLVPPGERVYTHGSRFPETATSSPGVPALALGLIKAPSPGNQVAMIASTLSAPLSGLLQRVREQYGEMPGLTLTKPQAMRLFGVAPSVCAAMFRALVMENFLSCTGDGVFVRSTRQ